MSLDSLYLLNPEAENGLRIGQLIKLPKNRGEQELEPKDELNSDIDTTRGTEPQLAAVIDTSGGYLLYKVKTGDSFYALKQRYEVAQEELVASQPRSALTGWKWVNT
ncbi:MAG: hypothetical protein U5L96_05825 [Owenweeksia sp.]|nr:hypothetical protein [Owenweeksia sp.]